MSNSLLKAAGRKGRKDVMSTADARKILALLSDDSVITVEQNAKRPNSLSGERYASYCQAKTVAEYAALGGTTADFIYDLVKGIVEAPGSKTYPPTNKK